MIEVDDSLFKAALNRVAASDDGRIVLSYLKDALHWDEIYMASDNPQVTQYHATRRGVYASLRKLIDGKHLKEIEFHYKRKAGLNDGSGGANKRKHTAIKPRDAVNPDQ